LSAPPSPTKAIQAIGTEGIPSFVKLDTEKIDALVDLVGELLIAQSMVVQHPEVLKLPDRDLARYLRQLARITTDLQKNAMSLRMVPIRGAFQKMNRLVRDLAASQGKQIQLQLVGEEIELDRNIVEQLGDPLIHMVRNSVDHGIELPHVRAAQGKPEMGTIRLHALHQGGGIVIRISDDGKGMDKQKILAKATERGLVGSDFIPNEKDIFELIFAPGFSTADTITDISGRGVGMDVVRGCISRLRGRIEVQSTPGQGSNFTIRLPLTLAIIDGMLVGIGTERFIIPTLSIRESFRPQPDMLVKVQGTGEALRVRGKLIPLVRLADQLGISSRSRNPTDGIVIVTESGSVVQGLLVDQLIGKKEVVIKSLGDSLKDHPGMSGAAILGDGLVTLILDPDAMGSNLHTRPTIH
jgi:two-component system chemotaxis sensor kinase CheA